MRDLFDTTRVLDDAEYWDRLAAKVATAAQRESHTRGFESFAHSRANWAAACILLAIGGVLITLRTEDATGNGFTTEFNQVLAPTDDAGRALVSRAGPPAIGALLVADRVSQR